MAPSPRLDLHPVSILVDQQRPKIPDVRSTALKPTILFHKKRYHFSHLIIPIVKVKVGVYFHNIADYRSILLVSALNCAQIVSNFDTDKQRYSLGIIAL